MDFAFIDAVFFARIFSSPQYTLYPRGVGDYYGELDSSGNSTLLYSGEIRGGVFGGVVTAWLVLFHAGKQGSKSVLWLESPHRWSDLWKHRVRLHACR